MSGTVELVLTVEAATASEWMAGPITAGRGRTAGAVATKTPAAVAPGRASDAITQPALDDEVAPVKTSVDTGAAIAGALNRMPGVDAVGGIEQLTVRAFVEAKGAWRVMLMCGEGDARRIVAARVTELAPGVRQCETVCDEAIEAGMPLAARDRAAPSLKAALGKRSKLAPSPTLAVRRGIWRWTAPEGSTVGIELHDAYRISESASGAPPEELVVATAPDSAPMSASIAFCELRLSARIDDLHAASDGAISSSSAHTPRSSNEREETALRDTKADALAMALRTLFMAAAALADNLPVFPTLDDGYERSCAPAAGDGPVRAARLDVSDVASPHGALIGAAANVTRQWLGNEAGVRGGTAAHTEHVHQMRVGLRRLKTLLKTFPQWADDTWRRTLSPEIDWLGTLLGQARDLDVFVDATLPALAQADVDPAAWVPLQQRAAARREEARARARAALCTRRYAALSLAWLHWLAAQRSTIGPPSMRGTSIAGYAAKRVRKHYRRLVDHPELTALSPPERHRRRIEAKRLRYTLEFFESLASPKTQRKLAKQLGRIQSVLGDGSDATAALHFLEALDVPPYEHGFARGWCEAVNRWSAIEGERLLQTLSKPKIVRAGAPRTREAHAGRRGHL